MMHSMKCANCKHKFTHHLPECEISGCKCLQYTTANGNQMIVEHEPALKTFEQAEKSGLFKSSINPCIEWSDKLKRWKCRTCKKTGLWVSMGNHVHPEQVAKFYGVKVVAK